MNVFEQVFGNSGEQLGQAGVANYQAQAAEQIRSRRRMEAQVDAMNKCRGLQVDDVEEDSINILNNVITDQATLIKLLEQNNGSQSSSDDGGHRTQSQPAAEPQPAPPTRSRWGWMIPIIFGLLTLTSAGVAYTVVSSLLRNEYRYEFIEDSDDGAGVGEPSDGPAVRDLDVRISR